MDRIVIRDIFLNFILFLVLVLTPIFLSNSNYSNSNYLTYRYGQCVGLCICLFLLFLKEQIKFINISENEIIIQFNKLMKKNIL